MITIYLAQENSDPVEGKGPLVTVAAFTNKSDAIEAVRELAVRGALDARLGEIQVYQSFEEYEDARDAEIKRRALEKLSKNERKALGLE